MCRNKAAAGAACQLLGAGPAGQIISYEVCKGFIVWTTCLALTGFICSFLGGKGEIFGAFCFVLLEEWSVKERSSVGLVSASPHICSIPNLIKTLSLICFCLGQTSLWVCCSGSSLPCRPWTMSGRTVGFFFFISVHDSSRKLQESQESLICWGSGSLLARQDRSMAVAWGFTKHGVLHLPVPSQVDWFCQNLL